MPLELMRFDMLMPAFALVLARVAGLVLAVPMLSSRQIPRIIKLWLVVTLSLMAFPVVTSYLPTSLTLGQAAVGIMGEFIIGEILGIGAGMVFFAAQLAGKMISHQSGMALGTVFNPVFESQSTVLDQLWFFTILMMFLALRGHIAVVTVLIDSFKTLPPLSVYFDKALGEFLITILRNMFELGLRLGGPAILALLLTSLILGFLTKTMPQLNILSVGFSLKIVTALFVMGLTLPFSQEWVSNSLFDGLGYVGLVFEDLSESVIHGG
ncbi:MAG: flagellar biosynthetic protein FliR [Phycisphaerae bacterium]